MALGDCDKQHAPVTLYRQPSENEHMTDKTFIFRTLGNGFLLLFFVSISGAIWLLVFSASRVQRLHITPIVSLGSLCSRRVLVRRFCHRRRIANDGWSCGGGGGLGNNRSFLPRRRTNLSLKKTYHTTIMYALHNAYACIHVYATGMHSCTYVIVCACTHACTYGRTSPEKTLGGFEFGVSIDFGCILIPFKEGEWTRNPPKFALICM